ncbi:Exodeoxyribonuclease VII large subunit [Candidatus Kryptonium thompsonii]|jgi:exodeoxyribonuclease VII large subunit|uniref:Exodeoxyribonuclease 7 large subunit n=1 Tax=Candidatus Kryptonium thompsonii TaxID=1633631 RepID=A0A0P1LYU7_9BACT|nr:exodeoxyribonuclease VII large subunit [Candidatus Kryptonium thompsoni]CUS78965.1 Exodeoxyribonuclease VII large subunit [Candidatus Kryptonium thompsoni]CUS80569.1 Exodeoxyribonuclease VII large subunit [Candidatus Kryptonium thompsoni]CUS85258.1 Exodeoxyribonuclease VII large subunit [Candidatus Kryptonium thompsoni]CUS86314.1 Exodeoxyribonuclease VII large subunit [Candidatus Kryptonium thompsoni]CUS87222.1 Exodeoxyribonuclease VII large subunit [Candidatus Kryptonium thompsoni]
MYNYFPLISKEKILTVSELTYQIKKLVEPNFQDIWLQGEISNYKIHASGHVYFTLKDENASIDAALWKRYADIYLKNYTYKDGDKVLVHGKIEIYEPRGEYKIIVDFIEPLGIGELQIKFEMLKQKLAAEGLFDARFKKPIPEYPNRIGIVTSPTGAAIRDMINIISRRFPAVELILYPVKVQGDGAAEEIAQAIRDLNFYGKVDVIIVGRGGGSIEDLWAFNEEIVARAIFESKIPIISAVGHEIDYSISDFVADLRAPTPSAAAELVVKNRDDVIENIRNFWYTIHQLTIEKIKNAKKEVEHLTKSYAFNRPIDWLRQYTMRLDELTRALEIAMSHRFELIKNNFEQWLKRFESLNPELALKRGYAIVYKDGKIVHSKEELKLNDEFNVKLSDGIIKGVVKEYGEEK